MDRLTQLGEKYNTDKATGHKFTPFYDGYLSKYTNPTLLEIGIFDGASLKMWDEYYGNAKILGVDIEEKSKYESQNVKTIVADQSKSDELKKKCTDVYPEYDIIIDDGSHIVGHQIGTMAKMFPVLKSGGTYVLEDLHTSFIGCNYNPHQTNLTAYDFIYRLKKGWDIETPYSSQEEIDYIKNNISHVEIFQLNPDDYLHSITSVILKK